MTDLTATESAPDTVVAEPTGPTFEALGLSPALLKSLKDVGFEEPTVMGPNTVTPS